MMFVAEEWRLDVGFDAAQARLTNLLRGGSLLRSSMDAYGEGITGLLRVGPLGSALGISRLVEAYFGDVTVRDHSARLALRWQAIGPEGGLFPALDADLTLTAEGESATVLSLAGAYRPPLGTVGAALDRAVLHRVATATVRAFLGRVADAIAHPAAAAEPGRDGGQAGPLWRPPEPEVP